jgi:hypothetical protein
MTFADLGGLGPLSDQIVLVGDPGQIAPVVTGDSRRWQDWSAGPQRAAPEALVAAYPEAVTRLRLPHTWRLGPVTTSLIQPAFYADMPFTSVRPPRELVFDEASLPELEVQLVDAHAGPGDPSIAAAAAARVRALLNRGFVIDDGRSGHALQPQEVAVVTPHVEQASAISARLARTPGVTIGTANQLQGLEREAVVVVHPLAGYRETPSFATDPGRLCVALSRHRTHATILIDSATASVLRRAVLENAGDPTIALQAQLLTDLLQGVSAPPALYQCLPAS